MAKSNRLRVDKGGGSGDVRPLVAALVVALVALGSVAVLVGYGLAKKAQSPTAAGKSRLSRDSAGSSNRDRLDDQARGAGDAHQHAESRPEVVVSVAPSRANVEAKGSKLTGGDPDALAKELVQDVRAEVRDGIWARETESVIRENLERVIRRDGPVSLSSVYCGSSRCVVEGGSASRVDFGVASGAIQNIPGLSRGRIRLTKKEDGKFDYRAVLARDGFDVYGKPR